MTPIPVPIRQRIVQLYDRGKSTREIAQFCGFCVAAVRRVRQQFRERRTLEPRTHRSGRRTLLTPEPPAAARTAALGAPRRYAGRAGGRSRPAVPDVHDRSLARETGLEV